MQQILTLTEINDILNPFGLELAFSIGKGEEKGTRGSSKLVILRRGVDEQFFDRQAGPANAETAQVAIEHIEYLMEGFDSIRQELSDYLMGDYVTQTPESD